ncbi:uncharacterized protein [Garra rufa]|uniref:uncharacterized protein n=1 Tax=Garra rufa TaxID=137080 RepID=UPI003CCE7F7C
MEAAGTPQPTAEEFMQACVSRLDGQAQAIGALVGQVSELNQRMQQLRLPAAPPTPPAPLVLPTPSGAAPQYEPRLPTPEIYTGEPNFCRAFLARCSMHFALQPRTFTSEESKVAFVLTLLSGRAALWGTAVWENQDPCCSSFTTLADEMKRVFDRAVTGREAARVLADLKQGERSVSDYSIDFRTLAAEFPLLPLTDIIAVHALNGQSLPDITLITDSITLTVSGNHSESIPFYILDSPHAPIVLGHPWFTKHNPRIDWQLKSVSEWSIKCYESCLVSACPSVSSSVFQEKAADLCNVPAEYLDLKEVFSKSRAASLPPHRPYDCAIELLPGYIVSSEGMRMDPEKVKAVVDWPSPDSRKALQRFLGFANFYRRFIRNFSQLAAPLTALTSPRTTFRWSDAAEAAFANLKSRFVSAPILVTPDPSRQFVVEVDASEVGVGAVLSQRSPADDKMHPCAFFSHRMSPAETNYDIGNRELLAVKLALEEWRHWLEGSGVPFIVWTDHKNLEYIRTAKRLNSRQARWALFFGRFDFTLSYRPGSKNIKPDSLSRIFDRSDRPSTPEGIFPETLIVSALNWEVESKVKTALHGVTPPAGCPPNRLFVPDSLRSEVIQWGHCSNVACHPGFSVTVLFVFLGVRVRGVRVSLDVYVIVFVGLL